MDNKNYLIMKELIFIFENEFLNKKIKICFPYYHHSNPVYDAISHIMIPFTTVSSNKLCEIYYASENVLCDFLFNFLAIKDNKEFVELNKQNMKNGVLEIIFHIKDELNSKKYIFDLYHTILIPWMKKYLKHRKPKKLVPKEDSPEVKLINLKGRAYFLNTVIEILKEQNLYDPKKHYYKFENNVLTVSDELNKF